MSRKTICIGIVAFNGLDDQVANDYMSLMYYLGRNCPEYDFQLAIKGKSEQFRARNAIVKAALQNNADYIWMLDDDHIINMEGLSGKPGEGIGEYDFLQTLLDHDVDIVGPVYFQRGGAGSPVVMKEENGHYAFLSDSELTGGLQEVAVQGGGCMLLKMKIFDKVGSPWFEPEFDYGTDIQICRKARQKGFRVWTDSSIEIGHVMDQRVIVHSKNKHLYREEAATTVTNQVLAGWQTDSVLYKFKEDACEWMGIKGPDQDVELTTIADSYVFTSLALESEFGLGTPEYYAHMPKEQLARQVAYHHGDIPKAFMSFILNSIRDTKDRRAVDFGCGSAPVGFELCKRGHTLHFIDMDGAAAFEFLKWRIKKYDLQDRAIFNEWPEPESCDYALVLDSLEHITDWKPVIDKIVGSLKLGGHLLTNFFAIEDYENEEHLMMDKESVAGYLMGVKKMMPNTGFVWMRRQ